MSDYYLLKAAVKNYLRYKAAEQAGQDVTTIAPPIDLTLYYDTKELIDMAIEQGFDLSKIHIHRDTHGLGEAIKAKLRAGK